VARAEAAPDPADLAPWEVVTDPEAQPGDVVPALAALLLSLAEQDARKPANGVPLGGGAADGNGETRDT
jgi:hypothetical protein